MEFFVSKIEWKIYQSTPQWSKNYNGNVYINVTEWERKSKKKII